MLATVAGQCEGSIFTVKVSQTVLTTVWSLVTLPGPGQHLSQRQFSILDFEIPSFLLVRFSLFLMTGLHQHCHHCGAGATSC